MQEIRKFLEEQNTCKNPNCKTVKKTKKDKLFIQKNGYCMNCTIDREHEIRTSGLWEEYQNYKTWTRMVIYGKTKLDSYDISF